MPFQEVDPNKPIVVTEVTASGEVTTADVEARSRGLVHDSEMPDATEEMGPIGRSILGSLTALGGLLGTVWPLGLLLGFSVGEAAGQGPGASADTTAGLWMQVCAGISFIIAGWLMFARGRLIPVAIAAAVGLAFGVVGYLGLV